jgi:hypothetical protein
MNGDGVMLLKILPRSIPEIKTIKAGFNIAVIINKK